MKKKIATISQSEVDEIKSLYERKNGLMELSSILTVEKKDLYEKVIADLGQTSIAFQDWWNNKSNQYNWESSPEGHWEVDFVTGDIFLITTDNG